MAVLAVVVLAAAASVAAVAAGIAGMRRVKRFVATLDEVGSGLADAAAVIAGESAAATRGVEGVWRRAAAIRRGGGPSPR